MVVKYIHPDINYDEYTVPVTLGGTGANSLTGGASNLGLIQNSQVGQASGPIPLRANGTIDPALIPAGTGVNALCVQGTFALACNEVATYVITDYDSFKTYTVAFTAGTFVRNGDTITYTAPATAQTVTFSINGRSFSIPVTTSRIKQPSITVPVNGTTGLTAAPTFQATAFDYAGTTETHQNSDWQLATDAAFTNIAQTSMASTTNKTSWSPDPLAGVTTYYLRVRYRGSSGAVSDWSASSRFTTTTVPLVADYLAVGGGGGGGGGVGGGGGGGDVLPGTLNISTGVPIQITVGDGGLGGTGGGDGTSQPGANGGNTVIDGNIAPGGGGGGGGDQSRAGKNGGNGGGGGGANSGQGGNPGGTSTTGRGYPGGSCGSDTGGGGGGAGGPGQAGVPNAGAGGNGGTGKPSSITGTQVYYGGGGGGGNGAGSVGGTGGGGNGGPYPSVVGQGPYAGSPGTDNLGGGGGAAGQKAGPGYDRGFGGKGGKGVAIISVPLSAPIATTTGSPVITTTATRRIYTWNSVGNWSATWNF